jgi:Spy/CpxP family protein refolding chaperone
MDRALITLMVCALLVPAHSMHMSYASQQVYEIKTLPVDEVQGLLNGDGMGMARAAELNHYPGPRHVLDLASQLQLSDAQRDKAQDIYDRMHNEAARLGKTILRREEELELLFKKSKIDSNTLQTLVMEITRLRGELRLVHLLAHLEMERVLSQGQIGKYDELRGYRTREPIDKNHHHESH